METEQKPLKREISYENGTETIGKRIIIWKWKRNHWKENYHMEMEQKTIKRESSYRYERETIGKRIIVS